MDKEEYIKNLEREVESLRSIISAFENLTILSEQEHLEDKETINAFENLADFSARKREEDKNVIEALEKVTEFSTLEKKQRDMIIDALETINDFSRREQKEKESIISALQNLTEFSAREKLDKEAVINAYEHLTDLQAREKHDAESTIDAFERVSELYREELINSMRSAFDPRRPAHPLEKEIVKILDEDTENEQHILTKLHILSSQKNDGNFYSHLFNVLINMTFEEEDAKRYWKEILELNRETSKKMGRNVSFRVSMLDYFIDQNKHLKNPKIIEFHFFESTLSGAIYDSLTGLLNRTHLNIALRSALRNARLYKKYLGVVMFDLDNFKRFNDFFGHIEGDRLLKSLGEIFHGIFQPPNYVFRYGGEEFLAIIETDSISEIYELADRARDRLQEEWKSSIVPVSMSAGYAVFPEDGHTTDALISRADRTLYDAKYSGKNIVLRYSETRRRNSRLVTTRQVAYTRRGDTSREKVLARTVDVSRGGLAIELDTPLEKDDILDIYLDPKLCAEDSLLEGVVTWVRQKEDGTWLIGVEFTNENASRKVYLQYGDLDENQENEGDDPNFS
jgi:diguanylate cyclase (GGDEF)-like protein